MHTISKLAITIALGLSAAACAQGDAASSKSSMGSGMMSQGGMMGGHGSMMVKALRMEPAIKACRT
jgi:Spy/CpxP family protein refolding chaperone